MIRAGEISVLTVTAISTRRTSTPWLLAVDVMENFYVQSVCAPTRAEILTGRCYPRTGVKGVCLGAERLKLDEVTIADLLGNTLCRQL
jgi:arylsulfatase A-like enzyme